MASEKINQELLNVFRSEREKKILEYFTFYFKLGASVNKNVNWSDMWWTKSYESVLNNVNIQKGSKSKEEEEVDSTTSDEEVQVTKNNKQTKQVKTKFNKKVESDSESESSSNSDEESFVSKKRKRTLKILKF